VKFDYRPLLLAALAGAWLAAACGSSATTSSVTAPTTTRCQATITSSSSSFAAAGGSGTLAVATARECTWTASADATWITITSGAEGQGDGSVAFRIAANENPAIRRGAIVIGDQRADIGQEAAACEFALSAPSSGIDASGGQAVVDVRTRPGCGWQARSDASWLTVQPGSGTGEAEITITAAPNDGAERTSWQVVGG